MSDDHSNVGASEEHEADPAGMTDDGEVELKLPQEVVEEQVRPREDIRKPTRAINPGMMALDQEERHRFEPPNGARSKWPRHGLPLPRIRSPGSDLFGTPTAPTECRGRDTHVGGLRKEPGFPGLRWTLAGRWDTN